MGLKDRQTAWGGFFGHCNDEGGDLERIVLTGKRSLRLAASLKLRRRA